MSTKTSECLLAAGIKTIVWIDDHYSVPSRDDHVTEIQNDVEKLIEQGNLKIALPALEKIDLSQSKSKVKDLVDDVLEPMQDEEVGKLARQISLLSGTNKYHAPLKEDLSPADFKALQAAFGGGLRTFSLREWSTSSSGISNLASYAEDTLFLIDREFNQEYGGLGGTDGIELLAEIVNRTPACFLLLNHTFAETGQEDLSGSIAVSKNIKTHRFGVLSKRQNQKLSMDVRFACAVRAVMTHKFSGETAFFISETIRNSAEATAKALTARSFPELEQALFVNATKEGVFEYDAILRIFEIKQTHALNLAIKDSKMQIQLRAARKFREEITRSGLPKPESDMSYFKNLRRQEIYLEGEGLNKLHAPLCCGDVFEGDDHNKYLFLAQPCDLMVRKNSKRDAEVGYMVLISDTPPNEQEIQLPDYRFFDLDEFLGEGKRTLVDLRKFFVADLSILDFAVFNEDGRVELTRNHKEPTIVLTQGWSLRKSKALSRFFNDEKAPQPHNICLGEYSVKLAGSSTETSLRYPLRRIGRIEPITASAILVAWATFQTRAAFDHDFAKEMDKKNSMDGLQAAVKSAMIESAAEAKAGAQSGSNIKIATADKAAPAIDAHVEPTKAEVVEPVTAQAVTPEVKASPEMGRGS